MKKSARRLTIILIAAIGLGSYEQFSNPFSTAHKMYNLYRNQHLSQIERDARNKKIYTDDLIVHPSETFDNAKEVLALDSNKNKIVYSKNADKPIKVASLAKLMTLYLTIKKAQQIHGWQQIVDTTNPDLRKLGDDYELGGFKFQKGHKYTVKDLFKAALVQSSNNSAIALGEWVAGSNKKFIQMMNDQAAAWHLQAHFVSASGLENSDLRKFHYWQIGKEDEANMVSARSIAEIADHVLSVYPQIIDDSKQTTETVDGQTLFNENSLLEGKPFYDESLHVDGLKTGYTDAAGLCLVATGQRPGKDRIITVVIHDSSEFSDTAKLMKMVYRQSHLYK